MEKFRNNPSDHRTPANSGPIPFKFFNIAPGAGGRRIFAERFGADILAPLSRRTGRLETIVHHLGLALGGRPAAAFAD
ncbi:MAG: hypothetical protein EOQ57_35380, partial [Mesorhizobium sp.]